MVSLFLHEPRSGPTRYVHLPGLANQQQAEQHSILTTSLPLKKDARSRARIGAEKRLSVSGIIAPQMRW